MVDNSTEPSILSTRLTDPASTASNRPKPIDTEAADFQRLIKLSYTPTYTKRALNKEELLRRWLLVLANGYGMEWCLEECSEALRPIG